MAAAQRKRWAGRAEGQGCRGDAGASDGRPEETPPDPQGAHANHRGDEEAVGGGEEGQSRGESCRAEESHAGGGQTGREAYWHEKRQKNSRPAVAPRKALGRAKAATRSGEGARRAAAQARRKRRL
jgi:hypothetical protein